MLTLDLLDVKHWSCFPKKNKSFTKLRLLFALTLSLANFFAFLETSAMHIIETLFKENLYFIWIYKLLMYETFKSILHIKQLT